ncbi:hypothetical protein L6R50_20560 [Myxococcota bacterium]|nr:hypothetical protein [Myxococcota bacterium]
MIHSLKSAASTLGIAAGLALALGQAGLNPTEGLARARAMAADLQRAIDTAHARLAAVDVEPLPP